MFLPTSVDSCAVEFKAYDLYTPVVDWENLSVNNILIYPIWTAVVIINLLPPLSVDYCYIELYKDDLLTSVFNWDKKPTNGVIFYPHCFIVSVDDLLPPIPLNSCAITGSCAVS